MHQVGLNIFNDRDIEKIKQYSFERNVKDLDEPLKKIFMNNIQAWDFFQLQPPSYRKVASLWVVSAKREETRLKRLCILIEDSENKRRLKIVTLQKD
jgi:hypothetical protein